jgi:hypothetical protein
VVQGSDKEARLGAGARLRSEGRRQTRLLLGTLGSTLVAAVVVALLLPPIRQSQAYHDFADSRPCLGVPNAQNVISNLPFLAVGLLGLIRMMRNRGGDSLPGLIDPRERTIWCVAFAGMALTAFGSAWYHLAPDDRTLVFDRLPMTVVFVAVLLAVVAERTPWIPGPAALSIAVLLGAASVIRGHFGEAPDLRFYGLVQYYPAVATILLLALSPPRYTRGPGYLLALLLYSVAKALELLDRPIYSLGGIVSGHALKHLAAAAALYVLYRMVVRRRAADGP